MGDTGADVSRHGETCVHRKGRQALADRGGEGRGGEQALKIRSIWCPGGRGESVKEVEKEHPED